MDQPVHASLDGWLVRVTARSGADSAIFVALIRVQPGANGRWRRAALRLHQTASLDLPEGVQRRWRGFGRVGVAVTAPRYPGRALHRAGSAGWRPYVRVLATHRDPTPHPATQRRRLSCAVQMDTICLVGARPTYPSAYGADVAEAAGEADR